LKKRKQIFRKQICEKGVWKGQERGLFPRIVMCLWRRCVAKDQRQECPGEKNDLEAIGGFKKAKPSPDPPLL